MSSSAVEAPGDRGPQRAPLLHSLGQFSPARWAAAANGFSHGTHGVGHQN